MNFWPLRPVQHGGTEMSSDRCTGPGASRYRPQGAVVNLTPHPINLYAPECPDRIDPAVTKPYTVIPTSVEHSPARLVESSLGVHDVGLSLGVEFVEFATEVALPAADPRTWYVVSLPVALTRRDRTDLLVPYREVRNHAGTVVGCRQLARPV